MSEYFFRKTTKKYNYVIRLITNTLSIIKHFTTIDSLQDKHLSQVFWRTKNRQLPLDVF
jgi:hypothetical protein